MNYFCMLSILIVIIYFQSKIIVIIIKLHFQNNLPEYTTLQP